MSFDSQLNDLMSALLNNGPSGKPLIATVGVVKTSTGGDFENIYYFDQDAPGPPTAATLWEIGSITKTFTATMFARRIVAGNATFETMLYPLIKPYLVKDYIITESIRHLREITFVQLANYHSGLPTANKTPADPPGDFPIINMFNNLKNSTVINKPGTEFVYSNLGFALLADAIVSLDGPVPEPADLQQTYAQQLQSQVLDPLGMSDTVVYTTNLASEIPLGYTKQGTLGPPGNTSWPAYDGAGGIVYSGSDFQTWLKFNMGVDTGSITDPDKVLTRLRTKTDVTDKGVPISLAWFKKQYSRGTCFIKDGGVPRFNSSIAYDIDNGVGAYVVGNFHYPVEATVESILQLLIEYA